LICIEFGLDRAVLEEKVLNAYTVNGRQKTGNILHGLCPSQLHIHI